MKYSNARMEEREYDLLVAGGGPAGIGAAMAAARQGLRVLVVDGTGCLGGTATAGALPFWLGATSGSIPFREMLKKGLPYGALPHPRQAVGGIFTELMERIRAEGGGVGPCVLAQTDRHPGLDRLGCHDEFTFDIEIGKRVLEEAVLQAGAHILYYTTALDVEMEGGRITGVYLVNKDGLSFVRTRAVADCTGDADLVARAGYATWKGDRETGEMTLAGLVAHIEDIDAAAIERYLNEGNDPWFYDACAKARKAWPQADLPDFLIIFPMMDAGTFMVNGGTSFFGYDGTSAQDMTDLTIRARKRAQLLVEKVFRPFVPGAQHCKLRLTAAYPGVRETRRIVGEYTLTEQDMLTGAGFADTIALAGRHYDLGRKNGGQPFHNGQSRLGGGVGQIPYRALIPRGSSNIIAAGRCISADGQALGPARIMSTCMAVGQAAGTATALCLGRGVPYAQVDAQQLRDALRKDGAEINT